MAMTKAAKRLRKTVLRMAHAGNDGNLPSNFSSIEILRVLYDRVLRHELLDPDRFVLSKGQSTMSLLALLSEKGYIPAEELLTICRYDSRIGLQTDRTKLPCVEISAGSLGHGFPIAVGMAWGNQIKGRSGRVYTLAGDGEMNEGTMWEAALFAASQRLDNLTLIIDDNNSIDSMLDMGVLAEKLKAFGFCVTEANGHDEDDLECAIKKDHTGCPLAVIAKTFRGYGSTTLLHDKSWFHRAPTSEELCQLLQEVEDF